MTDFPVVDQIKGTPYEKMKLGNADRQRIVRRAKIDKIKPRRIDADESFSPLRLLAKKLIEMNGNGSKS